MSRNGRDAKTQRRHRKTYEEQQLEEPRRLELWQQPEEQRPEEPEEAR